MLLPPLSAEQRIKPPRFELRLSLLYFGIFLPLGIHLPYLPLWLASKGFDAEEIGVILAAPMFLRMVTTPAIMAFADKAKDRATVLTGMSLVAAIASCGYFLPQTYALVLAVSLVLTVGWTVQTPLGDSIALSGVRRFGSIYPKMRIWGSVSYLVANLLGGLFLSLAGTQSVPAMITFGLVLLLLISIFVPRLGPPRRASPSSAADLPKVGSLLKNPLFMLLASGTGLISASHAFLYGFASIYWHSIGLDETTVGLLWSVSVVAEIAVFLIFGRLFSHRSSPSILTVAGVVAVVRWILFPMVAPFGFGVPGFLFVQALHALSTGLILIGIQKVIAENVPEETTGGAQGVAYFASGFAMATATLVSGPLYAAFGVSGFFPMAVVAAAGILLVQIARRYPQSSGRGGDTSDPA